jgi:hypothetical protein
MQSQTKPPKHLRVSYPDRTDPGTGTQNKPDRVPGSNGGVPTYATALHQVKLPRKQPQRFAVDAFQRQGLLSTDESLITAIEQLDAASSEHPLFAKKPAWKPSTPLLRVLNWYLKRAAKATNATIYLEKTTASEPFSFFLRDIGEEAHHFCLMPVDYLPKLEAQRPQAFALMLRALKPLYMLTTNWRDGQDDWYHESAAEDDEAEDDEYFSKKLSHYYKEGEPELYGARISGMPMPDLDELHAEATYLTWTQNPIDRACGQWVQALAVFLRQKPSWDAVLNLAESLNLIHGVDLDDQDMYPLFFSDYTRLVWSENDTMYERIEEHLNMLDADGGSLPPVTQQPLEAALKTGASAPWPAQLHALMEQGITLSRRLHKLLDTTP